MNIQHLGAALIALSFPTSAAAWEAVSGKELKSLLGGAKIVYEGGEWNVFYKNGKAVFNDGQRYDGRWKVRQNQFCSRYGSNSWDCWDTEIDGAGQIRFFRDSDDKIWIGTFLE